MFNKLRRYLPDAESLRQHPHIQRFGNQMQHSPIWHVNRRSASRGVSVGMFFAFLPIPFRTLPVIVFSIISGANLPIAIVCTWIFNNIVLGPSYYYGFKLGQYLLQIPENSDALSFNVQQLLELLMVSWQPLMLGNVVIASVMSLSSYCLARAFWRYRTVKRWQRRNNSR